MSCLLEKVQAPLTVPRDGRLFAFAPNGELTGVWLAGMECTECSDFLLLAHKEEMSLHYAVLRLCQAQEPRLKNVFELGANARVRLRAGSGSRLFRLYNRAGRPDRLTLEDVYVLLQPDVQALYRSEAQKLSGGTDLTHTGWKDVMAKLDLAVWPALERLFWAAGLIPCDVARIQNLTDLYLYRG